MLGNRLAGAVTQQDMWRVWLVTIQSFMKNLWRNLANSAFAAMFMLLFSYEMPAQTERARALDVLLSNARFDLAGWIVNAGWDKLKYEFDVPHLDLSEAEQVQHVRDLMRHIDQADKLEAEVAARYANPNERNPAAATAALRAERDALLQRIDADRPLAEAILQAQAESVLREEDFGLAGQPMPPLRFRLTKLPHILIMSRRDRIDRIDQRELAVDLSVDAADRIERAVDARFDVSSLVTPIGGYSTYPTMLPETSSLRFIIETSLHEWTHNYLFFSWVGTAYDRDPVARTINETTASIVQRELGVRVIERFYPDLLPSLLPNSQPTESALEHLVASLAVDVAAQNTFDFNHEMRITRIRVDELLGAGRITEAERYMEERREAFIAAGYGLRKLNQAYFAFYGAYNAEPGGAPAAGKDTIGPAVQALRARSPSVGAFVRAVAQLNGLDTIQTSAP
jgi:hypothetical protein